jgi:hypothetical protein
MNITTLNLQSLGVTFLRCQAPPPPPAAPELLSATILADGETVEFVFDENVNIGAGGSTGWTLDMSGGAATVTYDSGDGTDTLTYTISRIVNDDETGTVDYTQPTDGIEDDGGLDLVSITNAAVTNNSSQGGGTSPGTSNLVAWYDFNGDATDAHAAYDSTTEGSPAYTAGPPSYITLTTAKRMYNVAGLGAAFNAAAGDCAFVVRFRVHTSMANNTFWLLGGRFSVIWNTAGISGQLSEVTKQHSAAASLDTWYTAVISWNEATDTVSVSINGSAFETATGTPNYVNNTVYIGDQTNVEIDFLGFYTKQLTADNVTWLYNSDGTRTYSDL